LNPDNDSPVYPLNSNCSSPTVSRAINNIECEKVLMSNSIEDLSINERHQTNSNHNRQRTHYIKCSTNRENHCCYDSSSQVSSRNQVKWRLKLIFFGRRIVCLLVE